MFRFEHPEYLYVLLALPIVFVLFLTMWYARKRLLRKFGDLELINRLAPDFSKYKHWVKLSLLLTALAFLIVGWANPQWGAKREKVKRKSVDVFVALDISRSMLSNDIPPSRLERAKKFTEKLIAGLKGERIGFIIFAGNAYLQMPLTTDYASAALFVKSANPDMAPSQGTAISDAIDLAERSFEQDNKHHKAIIIISDGENHEKEAELRAREASDNGLLIYTVGVGTTEGGFIPVNYGGRPDFKRDLTGNPVRTRINEEMLSTLADIGNGNYFNLRDSDEIISLLRERIDRIEKRELEQRSFTEYESYFQYFILIGLLFLIAEFILSYRQSAWLKGKDIFKVN